MKKILVIISSILMVLSCALISVSAHNEKIVVIDAGHGGEDGGASYLNCVESEINLEIAYDLKKVYEEYSPTSAECIVLDPKTFEILAMANYPS